jgi:MFS family permease
VPRHRSPWAVLALVCAANFLVILDVAIVNVALPSVQSDLGFDPGELQWVISAYALTFGGLLLLGGRLGDLAGRRVVFMAGVAVFTVASLACGLAESQTALIARGRCRASAPR